VISGESRLMVPAEILSMAPRGRNHDLAVQADDMMKTARNMVSKLPPAIITDVVLTQILGQLDVRLVMHIFQKKDASRRVFNNVAEIGFTFWQELCAACPAAAQSTPSPWAGPAAAELIQESTDGKKVSTLRELNSSGELAQPMGLLAKRGFIPGARVRRITELEIVAGPGVSTELEIVTVDSRMVIVKDVDGKKTNKHMAFPHDEFVSKHRVIQYTEREDGCSAYIYIYVYMVVHAIYLSHEGQHARSLAMDCEHAR
jgi:hypothetical protein